MEKSCYKCLHRINEVDYGNGTQKYECDLFDEWIRNKDSSNHVCDEFVNYEITNANFRNIKEKDNES